MSAVPGRGRLTDEDRSRIEQLAGRGFTSGRIAQVIKRHPSTVAWFLYSSGLKAPAPTPEIAKTYVRKGATVRRFCAEEDAFIQALRIQSFHPKKIAELASARFGGRRTEHSVRVRLTMLANREKEA